MALINSSSFLLLKDEIIIGHSTSTSFSLNLDLPDTTTKDSMGWTEVMACVRGGQITASGLTAYNDSLNFQQFADYVIGKSKVVFYFKQTTDPELICRGEGFIESVDETGDNDVISEFNVEIKLTGPVTAGTDKNWENVFRLWEDIADAWNNV